MSKIDFNDNKWTSGIQLPDKLITVNGSDDYRILEALNIDWEHISLPWAQQITKWNAKNVDPNQDYDAFLNDWNGRNTTEVDNKVDWLNKTYDYLKDNGYFNETTNKFELPGWAVNGQIEKSQDIIDVINYLLWRVITIDFYTNNWNARNSTPTTADWIIGWSNLGNYKIDNREYDYPVGWDPQYYYSELAFGTEPFGTVYLQPTADREPQNILISNSLFKLSVNKTDVGAIYSSTSNGQIIISNKPNTNIIPTLTIGGVDGREFIEISQGNEKYFKFKVNALVNGTAQIYQAPESFLYRYFVENSYDNFDPDTYNTTVSIKQLASQITIGENTTEMSEFNKSLPIHIYKNYSDKEDNDNTLSNVSFNGNPISITKSSVNGITKTKYVSTKRNGSGNNAYDVSCPFYLTLDGYSNEYPINFDLRWGAEYGIKPFFAIKSGNSAAPNLSLNYSNGTCVSDLGNIILKNGVYYYVPPVQPNSDDPNYVTISCVFYYNDTTGSRPICPTFLDFIVCLNPEVKNTIQFSYKGQNHWRLNGQSSWGWVKDNNGSQIVSSNEYYTFHADDIHNVSYCIATVNYNDTIDSNKNVLIFDDFIHTQCNTDYTVECLGVAYSTSYAGRTISMDIEHPENGVYGISTANGNNYNIHKNTTIKVNPEKEFYYIDGDDAENYDIANNIRNELFSGNDFIDDRNTTHDIVNYIQTDEEYIKKISPTSKYSGKKWVYEIQKSTAIYPNMNGVFNDGAKWVDADNDYYYVVFKISTLAATKGAISYSGSKGYLFIKVLRNTETPSLNFISLSDYSNGKLVNYKVGNDENTYSFRVLPKLPIFLNRLLTESSQQLLKQYTGNKYWEFYNVDGSEQSTTKWDDTKAAIKDDRENGTNEVYMYIFNEGDSYNYSAYNQSKNENTVISPEAPMYFINTASNRTTQVGAFEATSGNTRSGAILYINKFMRAIRDTSDNLLGYGPVDNDYVEISLVLSIGNDNKFKRVDSRRHLQLTIYKQEYDINILTAPAAEQRVFSTYNKLSSFYEITVKEWSTQNSTTLQNIPFIDCDRIFIGSNEFGSGSVSSAEYTDQLPITLDNGTPILTLNSKKIPITIKEGNINSSRWVISGSEQINPNDSEFASNNLMILYSTELNNNSQPYTKNAIFLLAKNSSGQNPEHFTLNIAGDEYGIYKDKDISFYYKCIPDNSQVDVQTGE